MARIVIVGDGPGGLSAALFLAKNGHEVEVFGKNKTAVNFAQLHNYLGVEDMAGTDFQTVALRQVKEVGAVLHDAEVTSVAIDGDEVRASTDSGTVAADYLILSEGKKPELAASLGLAERDGAIAVDGDSRSSHPRVYVVGRSVRPTRSQAIISAGDGAKAALDIMAREAGEEIQDWDTPPKG